MPEVTILQCDAPGCEEVGEKESFTLQGKTYEVILGPKHREHLRLLADWGRAVRSAKPARRSRGRGTDEQRLLTLLDADKRVDGHG